MNSVEPLRVVEGRPWSIEFGFGSHMRMMKLRTRKRNLKMNGGHGSLRCVAEERLNGRRPHAGLEGIVDSW